MYQYSIGRPYQLTSGSDTALAPEFESASGLYFDNDSERFADPHSDALDADKCEAVVQAIEQVLASA